VDKGIRTALYQMRMGHKCFAEPLNGVRVVKTNLRTGATAHVVLFSSDQELTDDRRVHYDRLRFQLEFNFRDAKRYWGLEDFMGVKSTPVANSANLALSCSTDGQSFSGAHPTASSSVPRVQCQRSESGVSRPKVRPRSIKMAAGNARANYY
jgi:hypothetical protein